MSCPPPHPQGQGQRRPPALELLLDEYWFFSNTLANTNNNKPSTERGEKQPGSSSAGGRRRLLLRTPSLPPPRAGGMMPSISKQDEEEDLAVEAGGSGNQQHEQQQQQQQEEEEVEDDDLNWSSIYEGVLRTRMAEGSSSRPRPAALRREPSMPVPGPASATAQRQSSKQQPTRRRHVPSSGATSQQQQPALSRSRSSVFRDTKSRSSSDLESIEVQGFRDLGFVFDKDDLRLRESLAGVLPGLKLSQPAANSRSRPYLSEAWLRPPALVRVQSEAEVKDQLRMWAQAVACNARQEC